MSSSRESIVSHVVSEINSIASIKKVTRDPVDLTELSRESFPHVYVETANERRENASFGDEVRRVADLDILLNLVVHGANRDSSRNTQLEAIEQKLMEDVTLGNRCYECTVDEILIREIGETEPYGQAAMVLRVRYFYERSNP